MEQPVKEAFVFARDVLEIGAMHVITALLAGPPTQPLSVRRCVCSWSC